MSISFLPDPYLSTTEHDSDREGGEGSTGGKGLFQDAFGGPDEAVPDGVVADGSIFVLGFFGGITPGMIEVEDDGVIANLNPTQAEIDQTFAEFAILTSILHLFVVTVDANQIGLPSRSTMSVPGRLSRGEEIPEWGGLSGHVFVPRVPGQAVGSQPARIKNLTTGNVGWGNALTELHRQFSVTPGKEMSGSSKPPVNCDEVRPWDAVAIRKHQVVTGRGVGGLVEDGTFLKTIVRVPNMLDIETGIRTNPFDSLAGLGARTIVGNHELKIPVRLTRVTQE